ncbi:MiAMP1 family antimicrobial peptide [Streptomyces lushanensis]|uniref:MiAMP1 family antimicrobial peptide n=1 Tax=Streptomyces lushanensis TaxID=1434255 RepID=UPI00082982C4|nr:MiAMP1 family antimicrobial peptide [Streptomyces lushanensis]
MRNRHTLRLAVTSAVTSAVLALTSGAALASDWYGYPQSNQKGQPQHILACGCSNLDEGKRGSYYFDHRGQDATMFNDRDCPRGHGHYTFRGDSERNASFGWKSIHIHC